MNTAQAVGAVLCDDLMFSSRITGTARSLGLQARVCRTPVDVQALAAAERVACAIVDLHHPGLDVASFVAALKERGPITIVGFGSHVAADLLQAARAGGCDVVLPRSQFVQMLPTALAEWFGQTGAK
jgi:CheY-like chemotaxis protein